MQWAYRQRNFADRYPGMSLSRLIGLSETRECERR